MEKKIWISILTVCIITSSISVNAASLSDEKSKLSNLETSLSETVNEITELEKQMEENNMEIIETEAKLSAAEAEQTKEYENIKKRIRYMYENDTSSYLEFIFTSSSFSDFINKVNYTSELMNYDRNKMEEYKTLISDIEKEKEIMEEKKKELEELKNEIEKKKESLEKEVEKQKQVVEEMSEQTRENISNAINSNVSITYTTPNDYGYSDQQLDLICAIVAQECSSSYEGSLAVITCALNRCVSSKWSYLGSDPLSQLCARGQFTYSIDGKYKKRLNGNYADFVRQAVLDALAGKRNHNYLSFRGYRKPGSVNIGDNWYFSPM